MHPQGRFPFDVSRMRVGMSTTAPSASSRHVEDQIFFGRGAAADGPDEGSAAGCSAWAMASMVAARRSAA